MSRSGLWAHADFMRLWSAQAISAFGSRITRNIREDKGYTYSPGSFIWTRKGASMWVETADVTSNVTGASLTEIFKEIDRLRTEAPGEAEVTGIKNNLAGVFTIQNSSRFGLINQLEFVDLHGLGESPRIARINTERLVRKYRLDSFRLRLRSSRRVDARIAGRIEAAPQRGLVFVEVLAHSLSPVLHDEARMINDEQPAKKPLLVVQPVQKRMVLAGA